MVAASFANRLLIEFDVHFGVGWGCPGGALEWPGGGLDRFYYPGTTRELPGIWAGCVGASGLAESAGKEFGQLAKNIAAY